MASRTTTELPGVVGEVLSDAWSSGTHLARDVAAGAVERAGGLASEALEVASELGSAAAGQLATGTERVAELVSAARGQRPSRRPLIARPWFLLLVAGIGFAGTAWWLRGRSSSRHAPAGGSTSPAAVSAARPSSPNSDSAAGTVADTGQTTGTAAGGQDAAT